MEVQESVSNIVDVGLKSGTQAAVVGAAVAQEAPTHFEEKGNFVKAASYYLMISDITQAIQVLVNANFFQAAVTIVKTRLVKDHPLLLDLYKQWALKSHEDGAYGMEAKCWIAINELEKAGSALAKTGDGHSLRVASEMYSKNGDNEKDHFKEDYTHLD